MVNNYEVTFSLSVAMYFLAPYNSPVQKPSFLGNREKVAFSINPLSLKGDQHHISPCNINAL